MKYRHSLKHFCFIIFITIFIQGCSVPAIKGVVVDSNSGHLIENADIIAFWDKRIAHVGGSNYEGIAHAFHVTTNNKGEFTLPRWFHIPNLPLAYFDEPKLIVFKRGYIPFKFNFGVINFELTRWTGEVLIRDETKYFGKAHKAVGKEIEKLEKWMENLDEPEYEIRISSYYDKTEKKFKMTEPEKHEMSKYDRLEKNQYKLKLFKAYYEGVFRLDPIPPTTTNFAIHLSDYLHEDVISYLGEKEITIITGNFSKLQ